MSDAALTDPDADVVDAPPPPPDVVPFVAGEAGVEVARIELSASTNSCSAEVIVYADASAVRTVGATRWFEGIVPDGGACDREPQPRAFPPDSPEVIRFLQDLAAVGDVSAIPTYPEPICPKSVSFATTLHLSSAGRGSGDLECAAAANSEQASLIQDCAALTYY